MLWPADARIRNLTYGCNLYTDVSVKYVHCLWECLVGMDGGTRVAVVVWALGCCGLTDRRAYSTHACTSFSYDAGWWSWTTRAPRRTGSGSTR